MTDDNSKSESFWKEQVVPRWKRHIVESFWKKQVVSRWKRHIGIKVTRTENEQETPFWLEQAIICLIIGFLTTLGYMIPLITLEENNIPNIITILSILVPTSIWIFIDFLMKKNEQYAYIISSYSPTIKRARAFYHTILIFFGVFILIMLLTPTIMPNNIKKVALLICFAIMSYYTASLLLWYIQVEDDEFIESVKKALYEAKDLAEFSKNYEILYNKTNNFEIYQIVDSLNWKGSKVITTLFQNAKDDEKNNSDRLKVIMMFTYRLLAAKDKYGLIQYLMMLQCYKEIFKFVQKLEMNSSVLLPYYYDGLKRCSLEVYRSFLELPEVIKDSDRIEVQTLKNELNQILQEACRQDKDCQENCDNLKSETNSQNT